MSFIFQRSAFSPIHFIALECIDNIMKIDWKREIFWMRHSQHFCFRHIRFWKNYSPFFSTFDHCEIFSDDFFRSVISAVHHVCFVNLSLDFFMNVCCRERCSVPFNFEIIRRLKSNIFNFDDVLKDIYQLILWWIIFGRFFFLSLILKKQDWFTRIL